MAACRLDCCCCVSGGIDAACARGRGVCKVREVLLNVLDAARGVAPRGSRGRAVLFILAAGMDYALSDFYDPGTWTVQGARKRLSEATASSFSAAGSSVANTGWRAVG